MDIGTCKAIEEASINGHSLSIISCHMISFVLSIYRATQTEYKAIITTIYAGLSIIVIFKYFFRDPSRFLKPVIVYLLFAGLFYWIWSNDKILLDFIYFPLMELPDKFHSFVNSFFSESTDVNQILYRMLKDFFSAGFLGFFLQVYSIKFYLLLIVMLGIVFLLAVKVVMFFIFIGVINILFVFCIFFIPLGALILMRKVTLTLFKNIATYSLYPFILEVLLAFSTSPFLLHEGEIGKATSLKILLSMLLMILSSIVMLWFVPKLAAMITEGVPSGVAEAGRSVQSFFHTARNFAVTKISGGAAAPAVFAQGAAKTKTAAASVSASRALVPKPLQLAYNPQTKKPNITRLLEYNQKKDNK